MTAPSDFEQRAYALAKQHDFNEAYLAYRRDRLMAGSYADAADRFDSDLYWRAWSIACKHNETVLDRLRRKMTRCAAAISGILLKVTC